jgi:hypothetical protein
MAGRYGIFHYYQYLWNCFSVYTRVLNYGLGEGIRMKKVVLTEYIRHELIRAGFYPLL